MAEPDPADVNVKEYVRQLTPQVRSRLLAELERLHLVGQSIPRTEALIAALRAEFRDIGQSHYRVGNPSRYFFEPLEEVLVNGAPERANSGQVGRGSLAPIWSLISEQLLPSMAADYVASAKQVIVANNLNEAQRMAAAFRKKVVTYLGGVLSSADGVATVRAGLDAYTSSRAIFDDLTKMLRLMHAHEALAEFSGRLPPKIKAMDAPPKIKTLEAESLFKVLGLLDELRAKRAEVIPFALTITANRLQTPWQLILLATKVAGSKAVSKIAATPYAVAVSMVLDRIDDKPPVALRRAQNQSHSGGERYPRRDLCDRGGDASAHCARWIGLGQSAARHDGGDRCRPRCRNQHHSDRRSASHAHYAIVQAPHPFPARALGAHDQEKPRRTHRDAAALKVAIVRCSAGGGSMATSDPIASRGAPDKGVSSRVGAPAGTATQQVENNKKAGRDRHHHGRALRRRLMGQGGITGCRDDSPRPKSFLAARKFFGHG